MCLKYFEVIMLVSLFLEECLTSDQSQRSDEIQVICFFSLWASPRQEYGNIKKTTTYRTLTNFSDVVPFARKIEEASVWHMSHEKDPAQGEAWSHLCLCTKEDGWLEVWFGMFDGTKRFKWVGVCVVYSEPKEDWRPPPIPATCRAVSGSKEIQPVNKDTTWGYFRTAAYHLLQILPLDSMKSSVVSLCPYKAWPNKVILE